MLTELKYAQIKTLLDNDHQLKIKNFGQWRVGQKHNYKASNFSFA